MDRYQHEALRIQNENDFSAQALKTFRFQYANIPVYRKYVQLLNIHPQDIQKIEEIPFLPISAFKTHKVCPEGKKVDVTFVSSGTTGMERSRHFVHSEDIYTQSFRAGFSHFYGDIKDYAILALLPSYLEQGDSSLIYMITDLIEKTGNEHSGFYLHNYSELIEKVLYLESIGQKTILWGVSYALLDVLDISHFRLRNTIIMETGGMKGRRKEMVKEELHGVLKRGFGVEKIHSEYGMTELLSQAYSKGNGIFETPPWMKILVRDATDPLTLLPLHSTGGINVIDLSNFYSCAFISTQDLGKVTGENTFEIVGRFDHTDIRGCNLLLA